MKRLHRTISKRRRTAVERRSSQAVDDEPEPLLVLTGERELGRHLVRFDGNDCWLSFSPFTYLCKLVHALLSTPRGYVRIDRRIVHRLRSALSVRSRSRIARLIHVGAKHEYRLRLDRSLVAVASDFRDLDPELFDNATTWADLCGFATARRQTGDRFAT